MDKEKLIQELTFKAVRSSGKGGQHVNKVSTKVELYFDLNNSSILSEEEKEKLKETLSNRLNKEGILKLQNSDTRSQFQNKQSVIQQFFELIENGLQEQKERKATKIPKTVKVKRLQSKRFQSQKKANRKKPDLD